MYIPQRTAFRSEPAGRARDSVEVLEHLPHLLGDRLADAVAVGVERALAGEVEEAARDDALRVAAGRLRRFLRENGLAGHVGETSLAP